MIDTSRDYYAVITNDYDDTVAIQIAGRYIYLDIYDASVDVHAEGQKDLLHNFMLTLEELNAALNHFGYELVKR